MGTSSTVQQAGLVGMSRHGTFQPRNKGRRHVGYSACMFAAASRSLSDERHCSACDSHGVDLYLLLTTIVYVRIYFFGPSKRQTIKSGLSTDSLHS